MLKTKKSHFLSSFNKLLDTWRGLIPFVDGHLQLHFSNSLSFCIKAC